MMESVQEAMIQGSEDYLANPRSTWLLKWQTQIVLANAHLQWTSQITKALRSKQPGAHSFWHHGPLIWYHGPSYVCGARPDDILQCC